MVKKTGDVGGARGITLPQSVEKNVEGGKHLSAEEKAKLTKELKSAQAELTALGTSMMPAQEKSAKQAALTKTIESLKAALAGTPVSSTASQASAAPSAKSGFDGVKAAPVISEAARVEQGAKREAIDSMMKAASAEVATNSSVKASMTYPASISIASDSSELSLDNAETSALLSNLVYETDPKFVTDQLTKWGFTDIKLYNWDAAGSQAFVANRGDVTFVSVRGTENWRDIIQDAGAVNPNADNDIAGVTVHRGFRNNANTLYKPFQRVQTSDGYFYEGLRHVRRGMQAAIVSALENKSISELWKQEHLDPALLPEIVSNNLHDDVRARVLRPGQPPRKLMMTGHSLGAAVTTLLAARFQDAWQRTKGKEGAPVFQVNTFGSPIVGLEDFQKKYDHELGLKDKTFPWVHSNDFVTTIPIGLGSIFTDGAFFEHVAADHRMYLSPNNNELVIGASWKKRVADLNRKPLTSHLMNHYISRTSDLAAQARKDPALLGRLREEVRRKDAEGDRARGAAQAGATLR